MKRAWFLIAALSLVGCGAVTDDRKPAPTPEFVVRDVPTDTENTFVSGTVVEIKGHGRTCYVFVGYSYSAKTTLWCETTSTFEIKEKMTWRQRQHRSRKRNRNRKWN